MVENILLKAGRMIPMFGAVQPPKSWYKCRWVPPSRSWRRVSLNQAIRLNLTIEKLHQHILSKPKPHQYFDKMTARGPLLGGTAFITGAGSGIGQYTAFAFANNGVQNFGLTDIKPENLQSTVQKLQELNKNVEIEAIEMDVANEQGVISAIERTANRFGRIDYAINNAGIEGPLVPTADMELQGWVRCLDVNITVSVSSQLNRVTM
jgi:hypothetical protein